jgi:hypothetical protein
MLSVVRARSWEVAGPALAGMSLRFFGAHRRPLGTGVLTRGQLAEDCHRGRSPQENLRGRADRQENR